MRCPACHEDDDRVVDSRTAEQGAAIRRRRQCAVCDHRWTTFERVEEAPLVVVKRSGRSEVFDGAKLAAGVRRAAVSRPVDDLAIEALAEAVEEEMREVGPEVTTEAVGLTVLERLRALDAVAYLRFASVYKEFEDIADFEREAQLLHSESLEKLTAPKVEGEGHPALPAEAETR